MDTNFVKEILLWAKLSDVHLLMDDITDQFQNSSQGKWQVAWVLLYILKSLVT